MTLIRHWKCDEIAANTSVIDTTGNSNAILNGGNTSDKHSATGPGTAITNSFALDGNGDYLDISAITIGTNWSLSLFFYGNVYDGDQFFYGHQSDNSQPFGRTSNTTTISCRGTSENLVFTVPTMSTGTWYHLLRTKAGSTHRCFLNGTESSSGSLISNQNGSVNCIAGYTSFGAGSTFNGRISWIKWFNSDESANAAALYAERNSSSSAITGTSNLVLTNAGQLIGTGACLGTSLLGFINSGQLIGSGTLVGTSTLTFTLNGQFLGIGLVTGTNNFIFTPGGQLIGSGVLSGTTLLIYSNSGQLLGTGQLSGTGNLTFTCSLSQVSSTVLPIFEYYYRRRR